MGSYTYTTLLSDSVVDHKSHRIAIGRVRLVARLGETGLFTLRKRVVLSPCMRFPSAPTARRDGLGSVLDETEPSDRPLRPLRPLRYAESGPCGRPRALCRMRSACRDLPRRVRLDPARATAPALQPRPETRPRVLGVQELVGFFTVHRHGLVHEDVDRRHGEGVVVGRVGGGHCRGRRAHDR